MFIPVPDALGWELPRYLLGESGEKRTRRRLTLSPLPWRGGAARLTRPPSPCQQPRKRTAPSRNSAKPSAQQAEYRQGYNLNLPLRFRRVKIEKSQFLKFAKDCVGRSAEEGQRERRRQESQTQTWGVALLPRGGV